MNIIPTPQYANYVFAKNKNIYNDLLDFTYCDDDLKKDVEITSSFAGKFKFVSISEAKVMTMMLDSCGIY